MPTIVHATDSGEVVEYNKEAVNLFGLPESGNFNSLIGEISKRIPKSKAPGYSKSGPYDVVTRMGAAVSFFISRKKLRRNGVSFYVDCFTKHDAPVSSKINGLATDLIRSHASMRETLLFAKTGSAELDLNTGMVTLSCELLHLLDSPSDVPRAIHITDFIEVYIHPEYKEMICGLVFPEMGRDDENKREVNVTFEMITARQGRIWIEAKGIFKKNTALGILQDVSDRKKAEQDKVIANNLSESIINSLPGVFYLFNQKGKFLRWNRNFEVVSEYSGEEISRMHPLDFFDSIDRDIIHMKIGEVFDKGTAEVEAHFITKSKKRLPYYFNGWAREFQQESCVIGMGLDISSRVDARAELEKSESELRAIIDASAQASLLLDPEGHVKNFNARVSEIAGLVLMDQIEKGAHFASFIPVLFQQEFRTNFDKALGGKCILVEREVYTAQEKKIWLEFIYLPVQNKRMEVIGVSFNINDISIKKESEAQFRKSTDQIRFAARLARFGEWELDLITQVYKWSDEVCRIHDAKPGYSPDFNEVTNFYTDESQPLLKYAIERCIEQGDWYDLTVQIITKTGRKKWIRIVGVSERVNGKAVKLYGLEQDVDDVKQKQEELARLALIAKETNNMVVITGPDRKIQWVNESFTRKTGYTLPEVIGKSPGELLQGSDSDADTIGLVRIGLDRQEPVKFELINYSKTGQKYWVEIEIQPVFGSSGELDYFIGIQSDITTRKLAEDSLKESEQRFRTLADSAPVMMWMSGADQMCFYFNRGWLDFRGRTLEEDYGNGWVTGVHSEDRKAFSKTFSDSFERRQEFITEYRLLDRNNNYRWVLNRGIPRFLPDGEFIGFIGSCFDIHDRKTAEENLQLSQEGLQLSLMEKEGLIKEIHHRVKNNLQLISSVLYLKMSSMHQSDMKDFLEQTRHKIHSIALIHERLLQSGSMHQVDVNDYLTKLILDLQMTVMSQRLDLQFITDLEVTEISLDVAINCGLILNELITNAIKHAFKDRSEGTIHVMFNKNNTGFNFSVSDNGCGLPEDIGPGKGGFGMQLLDVFFRQLKSTVQIERFHGTRFIIEFK